MPQPTTAPQPASDEPTVLRAVPDIPLWQTAGIRTVGRRAGSATQVMDIPEWMRDRTGAVVPGSLGLIADSALGGAVMSRVGEDLTMVTSHLHLEILAPIAPGAREVRVDGRCRALATRFGIGEGDAADEAGNEIARATIGVVLMSVAPPTPQPAGAGAQLDTERPDPPPMASRPGLRRHALIAGDPIHERLGTAVVSARRTGVRIRVPADPTLANSKRGLHGGVGVLLGERVLDLALLVALRAADRDPDGDDGMRLVELRASFVRGIVTDGTDITCRASVMHLGRRLAAARGEVCDQHGRPAVLVDATYVASGFLAGPSAHATAPRGAP